MEEYNHTKETYSKLKPSIDKQNRPHSRTALILSVFVMGLGQLYNKQYTKGFLMFLFYLFSLYTAIFKVPHAFWGIVTLGTKSSHLEKVGRIYQNVPGDHSIFLLIQGLITLFLFFIIIIAYIMIMMDAYKIGKLREKGLNPHTFKQTLHYLFEYKFPFFALSIPMLGILFFTVLPILFMVLIAFTDYTRNNQPPAHLVNWIGLKAFADIFRIKAWANTFYGVASWTLIWAIFSTLTCFFGGFATALLVQKKGIKIKKVWQTIFILPFAMPHFVSALILRNMFNGQFGPINQYLKLLGISPVPWLSDPVWAKITVLIINFWMGFPVTMLMVMGILTTINKEMYEAAELDGATGLQKLRFITYPSVMITMTPLLIMQFVTNINNFNVIFLTTGGSPTNGDYMYAGSTDILITWLYNLTMLEGKYNFASVIGIFIFILLAVYAIFNLRNTKSFKEEDIH
ncbi:carbohydrate ABC transporter permease [Niallia sp. 03133]|uniref:carbohydrate ABC transporter permease n=1 Tax=Niallia sp. 03133 TaxID=3458060 RepID=UPI004044AA58